jgi:hypothetical protein
MLGDPYFSSDLRFAAMGIMDAALPIAVFNTEASEHCDSVLPETYRRCSLLIDYQIENKTDDITFTNVAIACLAKVWSSAAAFVRSRVSSGLEAIHRHCEIGMCCIGWSAPWLLS